MEDQYGFIYSPERDPRTGFYISARSLSNVLDGPVTEADLPTLREGLMAGLEDLPECEIAYVKEINKEHAIGFEILLTFTLDGQKCRRLMRLLYRDQQQFVIHGQGRPIAEYDVFHDTFELVYNTFNFGDMLVAFGIPSTPENIVE